LNHLTVPVALGAAVGSAEVTVDTSDMVCLFASYINPEGFWLSVRDDDS